MDNKENSLFYSDNHNENEGATVHSKPFSLTINQKLQTILNQYVHYYIARDKEIEIKGTLIDFIRNIH